MNKFIQKRTALPVSASRQNNGLPNVQISTAKQPIGHISDVFNFLKRERGPSLSIEQLNEIAARAWSGER